MPGKLYIQATNIHQGGGRTLLQALLGALHGKAELVLSLDDRMPTPINIADNVQIKRVSPSVVQRISAEKWLARSVTAEDIVLCFGSLPPLFKLNGRVVVFVQNRYLIDDVKLGGFPFGVQLRLSIERLWFYTKLSNASEFIVQTPTMKRLLEINTRGRVPVRVLPFVAEPNGYARSVPQGDVQQGNDYDFVYVASGEPHKNHRRLIEAWCLLAEQGFFPSLCLTLDEGYFAGLCQEIDVMRQVYGLKVVNAGGLSHQDVLQLYTNATAAIYPSTFESFGLPLIEARQAGLPVLASELDYVRDVLDPEQTFDPKSSVSIAKAVKRFMGMRERPLPLLDAAGFLARMLDEAK
jgi:glycosyltransferase involved in cell wall biosynthesis